MHFPTFTRKQRGASQPRPAAGLETHWTDTRGRRQRVGRDTLEVLLDALQSDAEDDGPAPCMVVQVGDPFSTSGKPPPCFDEAHQAIALTRDREGRWLAPDRPGYYRLGDSAEARTLAVTPTRCFLPQDASLHAQPALWGLAAQVYSLRSNDDGGLGSSRTINALGQRVAVAGGDVVALSPLHAGSPITGHYSPYAPSHRGLLDTLQFDPLQVAGQAAWRAALQRSGMAEDWVAQERRRLIDWPKQYAMRRRILQCLFERWGQGASRAAWQRFAQERGDILRQHAVFAAQQNLRSEQGQDTDWRCWGAGWATPDAHEARDFERRHASHVDFEYFLQWLAHEAWHRTQSSLTEAGMRSGLLWDLAVGFVPGGSEAWQNTDSIVRGASLGAPADMFNAQGQSWGISAYSPQGLRRSGYRPLIALLRAMMARGGGMRIDHILGWSRLWLVPDGARAADGVYLRYPLQDMLGLLALESWRHRCIVIGEDLGNVPDGLRAILAERGVMGLDVLLFTRDEKGRFLAPRAWRDNAVAMSTTHDLPPLAGWREGRDVTALGTIQGWRQGDLRKHLKARQRDVAALDRMTRADTPLDPRRAALRSVARSRAPLAIVPLEDAVGTHAQVNLPGTMNEHPNWRRRLRWETSRLDAFLPWFEQQRSVVRHD